jgi:hypothetical protein
MAITPKKALGEKPERLKQEVTRLENTIDRQLSDHYDGRGSVTVSLDYNTDSWVVEELKRRYIAAGWSVAINKYAGDYRDDGYIHVTLTGTNYPEGY